MARPPRAEAPARPVCVRLSPDERTRLEEAARANDLTVSQFARDALVTAANDCLEGAEDDFVGRNPDTASR